MRKTRTSNCEPARRVHDPDPHEIALRAYANIETRYANAEVPMMRMRNKDARVMLYEYSKKVRAPRERACALCMPRGAQLRYACLRAALLLRV